MELLRAAFFFHPMVRWLLALLECERELLCDEAAVARGVDPRDYAHMLLEFARRSGGLLASGVGNHPLAIPFLTRGTLMARIDHLLEDDMKRWLSPLPTRRVLALAGVVLGLALSLGSARVIAVATGDGKTAAVDRVPARSVPIEIPAPKALAEHEIKAEAEENPFVEIHGTVVDAETGKPVPHYVVQYGRSDPNDPKRTIWGWSEARIESPNPLGLLRETLSEKGAWKRVLAAGYLPQPITEKPYDGEAGTIEVTVKLKRGQQIIGHVFDHMSNHLSKASVFLVGDRGAPNITGGMAVRLFVSGGDETVTKTVTDADGRFILTGAGADATTVVVSAPTLDIWVVPAPPQGKELDITLPEPGKLVFRYDIDGGEAEATIFLQLLRNERKGWDAAQNVREPKVANKGRLVLENLTPGTYDLARMKYNLLVGDMILHQACERRNAVVESGKTAEVAFVRESGAPVEGEVAGLKGLKLPGAYVLVNLGDEAKEGRPDRFAEKRVEAVTCNDTGGFKTPRLLPGTYTIVAEAYAPLTPEQRGRTGWRVPDYRAFAVVTVPKDGPAPKVRIEMPKPKAEAKPTDQGKNEEARGAVALGPLTARAQPPQRSVSPGDNPDNNVSDVTPPLERIVTLIREPTTRRTALRDICRQAGIALRLDDEALAAVGLRLDEPVSVSVTGEPLEDALGRLIDWRVHPGVYREVRGGTLVLTTLQATQERTLRHLPEWLKPLYNHGLLTTVDDAGDVTALTSGDVMTDELLAKLETLPKLRELDVEATKALTKVGMAHLGKLPALEILRLDNVNDQGAGLGDVALEAVSRVPTLRELSLGECGTTDAGVRYLEAMPQLTHLTLRQEGGLTDAALASVAKLKRLRHLDLSSYVGTVSYGRMHFTPEGLHQLASLQGLEVLWLPGHAPSADLFPFPKLTALSVGEVDDTAATRIAMCRSLRQLELLYSGITDDGLKQIATLPGLRRLSLSSTVITDAGIAHLKASPHLEHVELRATEVSDETLKHLAEITTLTRLDLHGSGLPGVNLGERFTAGGLQQLKRLPRLRALWLTNLRFNGGFGVLKELAQLRELSLEMTDISEGEVAALEDALPNTTINAMSGAGRVGPPKRR
jgi:hypothetical protein